MKRIIINEKELFHRRKSYKISKDTVGLLYAEYRDSVFRYW